MLGIDEHPSVERVAPRVGDAGATAAGQVQINDDAIVQSPRPVRFDARGKRHRNDALAARKTALAEEDRAGRGRVVFSGAIRPRHVGFDQLQANLSVDWDADQSAAPLLQFSTLGGPNQPQALRRLLTYAQFRHGRTPAKKREHPKVTSKSHKVV